MYISGVQTLSNQNFEAVRYKQRKSPRYRVKMPQRAVIPHKSLPKLTQSAHAASNSNAQISNEITFPWAVLRVAASGYR